MQRIEISVKYGQGDIVTLKAMVGDKELGEAQRLSIEYWDTTGGYEDDGTLHRPQVAYWCRVICCRDWGKHQEFVIGERLKTGLVLISEHELCLFSSIEAAEKK